MGFSILILIRIWSLVFDTPRFQILDLYLDLEGAKNIHVPQVLIGAKEDAGGSLLGFGFWNLDLDLDIVSCH